MNHWIFVVTKRKIGDQYCDPNKILEQRIEDKFWGLGTHTPNMKLLSKGDSVVFYVGGRGNMVFAAEATLTGKSFQLSPENKEEYRHNNPCYDSEYGVGLENAQWLDSPQAIRPLIQHLNFIRDQQNWGLSLRGSIIKLNKDDFERIINNTGNL
jgi:hypothetical protein